MRDRICVWFSFLLCLLLLGHPMCVRAAQEPVEDAVIFGDVYYNDTTNYRVVVMDVAGLLSESEKGMLVEQISEITDYGNVAFVTIDSNSGSAGGFAESCYSSLFGTQSGILFLIDMDNREIWIYCDGEIYRTITKSYANTITDNVYTYASKGAYYQCASKAFEQAYTLLEGRRIAQPMKYICNALLAVIGALLFNFGIVWLNSGLRKTKENEILAHALGYFSNTKPTRQFERSERTYSPRRSGGSGGGGGGGGGGRSGGGGGHSF